MEIQYTRRLEKIEAVLDEWLPDPSALSGQAKPGSSWLETTFGGWPLQEKSGRDRLQTNLVSEYAAELVRPCWDLYKRGGKRWRPLLMVLTAESIAGESGGEAALPFTPLVEFPHNASLIHDDIEDNSDERRGKPAVHLIYGTDTAINSGAFLYFLPLACLSAWAEDHRNCHKDTDLINNIWAIWADHMRALHLGQAMDISWHRDYHSLPGLDEYDRMCRLKTGRLASLAAVLGVYCSGVSAARKDVAGLAKVFGEAAEQLGVGFQILDDIMNLDTGIPGKKRGDDIVEGKKSLPVLLYLHRYPEKADFAARCFAAARDQGTGAPEVEEFIGALEEAGVLEEALEKGLGYIRESRRIYSAPECAGFPLKKEGQELLTGLIDSLN